MQASETKLQQMLEGTKQYVVPLFQKMYRWEESEWSKFWLDIVDFSDVDDSRLRPHFLGSIITMPIASTSQGVTKYMLIDGHQRLMTIFIVLILLRNKAREAGNDRFADEVHNTLLANQYQEGHDHFKLVSNYENRRALTDLLHGRVNGYNDGKLGNKSGVTNAYRYFERKLQQEENRDYRRLQRIITRYFSVVNIVLDPTDNPHVVFESLNAKIEPFPRPRESKQADLLCNYFLLRISIDKQEETYYRLWLPIERLLQERGNGSLTTFTHHFLRIDGNVIKKHDVYYALNERVPDNDEDAINYLQKLHEFSVYYKRLISPHKEPNPVLQKYFKRLKRIEVPTAYPVLLNFYSYFSNGIISRDEFVTLLKTLENYLIRRFICNIPTNQLPKIFSAVIKQVQQHYPDNIVEGFKVALQAHTYPNDKEFLLGFTETTFYGNKLRGRTTKLILETLEENFAHKEAIAFDNLTIEHIMPQTLSHQWQKELGEGWAETHALFVHTVGNLTLTEHKTELTDDDFATKQMILRNSHLELNRYFDNVSQWRRKEIEQRGADLARKALEVWSYFGQENSLATESEEITERTPNSFTFLGQHIQAENWEDGLIQILNTIIELEPEKFRRIAQIFSHFIAKDTSKLRDARILRNEYFIEVNLSPSDAQRLCSRIIQEIEIASEDSEDWWLE